MNDVKRFGVQIVFEDKPVLKLIIDGKVTGYPLRETQLTMLAKQAIEAFQLCQRPVVH